jgi:hypothetical protein
VGEGALPFDTVLEFGVANVQAIALTHVVKIYVLDRIELGNNWIRLIAVNLAICLIVATIQHFVYQAVHTWVLGLPYEKDGYTIRDHFAFVFIWLRYIGLWMVFYYVARIAKRYNRGQADRLATAAQ